MIGRQMLALAAIAALTHPASARTERWSATGTGPDTVVTDCTDCEEDLGILLKCEGAGDAAKLHVPFQARDENPADQAESRETEAIVFSVDGEAFSYAPDFELWGMIGYVPNIRLKRSDTLVEALRAGRSVDISLGGTSVQVPLKGSAAALSIFDRNCLWGDGTAAASSGQAGDAGQEMRDGRWQEYGYDNDDGSRTQTLTFGIPETDAWALNASCKPGAPEDGAALMLALDFGSREDGDDVKIRLQAGAYREEHAGTVSIQSEEYAGVETGIGMADRFWGALGEGETLEYGLDGEPMRSVPLRDVSAPLSRFLDACR